MEQVLNSLFPRPQHIQRLTSSFSLPKEPLLLLLGDVQKLQDVAEHVRICLESYAHTPRILARRRMTTECTPDIVLQIEPALSSNHEAYRVLIHPERVTLLGASEAGLFYAAVTLEQILRSASIDLASELALPSLVISDAPDFPHRGVMLDISRSKVPTLDTLYTLIDLFASLKINQLQLYMEHTFAYEGHQVVWEDASPLTGQDILALDRYCQMRHIELVPNQNSFGHMHHWLMHDEYKDLAECPEGIEHPFNRRKEPFGLCPTEPKSLHFLEDLYEQLLPHFQSRTFNVGLDETFDLGHGRSKEECERLGTGRVYLDFLQKIASLARTHDCVIQFWADIVLKHSEFLSLIPPDAIAMIWGYEANHAFEEQCKALSDSGLGFYVCPGTSSWNTFAGRTDNMLGNLQKAALYGARHGALGLLNTDWGDFGHMQPLSISYLGFTAGAAFSWSAKQHQDFTKEDWLQAVNTYVFKDPSGCLGQVAYDLGNAYSITGARSFNASPLFRLLVLFDRHSPQETEHITLESLQRNRDYILEAVRPLAEYTSQREDTQLVQRELQWVADILCFACDFATARLHVEGGTLAQIEQGVRQALRLRLHDLMEEHRALWGQRNRSGGLEASVAHLQFVVDALHVDEGL